MKAVVIPRPGGPEVLELRDVSAPVPGTHEVLVRVRASALNRADLLQRAGRYPAPPGSPADIPGIEFAGEIAELGPHATLWKPGQRVFGISSGGAHAEFLVAHERTLTSVPDNLDWSQAGAVPEAFITAHDALLTQAGVRPGESVLIHAIGSGVGLAAAQLVRAAGAIPFGTSRTGDKLERARKYGMEAGVESAPVEGLSDRLRALAPSGFDVLLDLVGGAVLAASIPAMALKGRILLVGTVAGNKVELPLGMVLGRRLRLTGTVLRARSLDEKIAVTEAFAREVVPLLASGKVRPVIDTQFPLAEIQAAHRHLESNQTFGKVVLVVD